MKLVHALIAACMLAAGPALAQAPAAAPGNPDVKPVQDWFVRCFPVQSVSPCDIFQELDNQRTRQRVMSLSFAYVPSQDRHHVQITVPLEVSIPQGVVIQTDSYTSPVLHYRMCTAEGCFVQVAMDNSMIEALARSGSSGRINVVANSGKTYPIQFSLKGFAAAHDSMVEQARAKAKAPAKPAGTAAP